MSDQQTDQPRLKTLQELLRELDPLGDLPAETIALCQQVYDHVAEAMEAAWQDEVADLQDELALKEDEVENLQDHVNELSDELEAVLDAEADELLDL